MTLTKFFCTLLVALAAAAPAHAQVIEIDSMGAAQTFDRPTLFTDTDAVAIQSARKRAEASDAPAMIAAAARNHGLEPGLLEALAWQESRGQMGAVSVKGALGIMQLMPMTAAELGVKPGDLGDNIRGGALYLRQQLDRFGSIPLALAAYNAGPGAVMRFGGIPPYRETQNYVSNILQRWRPVAPANPATPSIPSNPVMIEVSK